MQLLCLLQLEGKLSHCRSLDAEVASCRQVIQEREAEISQMRRQVQESVLHRPTLRDRAAQTLEVELKTCVVQTEESGIDAELRTHRHSKARAVQVVPHMTDRHVQVDMVTVGMTTASSVTTTLPHIPPLTHESNVDREGDKPGEDSEQSELSDVEEEVDTPTDDANDTPTSNILVMASGGTAVRGLTQCQVVL